MHDFVGKWRITEMELWAQDMVDMNELGNFDFYNNQGRLAFCAVEGNGQLHQLYGPIAS